MSAIPDDVMKASWEALFGSNVVRTPQRKLLVIAAANAILAERERCRAETLEAAAKVARKEAFNAISGAVVCHGEMTHREMESDADDIADAIRALGGGEG